MVVPPETQLDGKPTDPPNLRRLTWRDLIDSCWSVPSSVLRLVQSSTHVFHDPLQNFAAAWPQMEDANYKRVAMASLVKAVYMLELDRQENRTEENALAPSWWIPFKYKLTHKLIDKRDGSIFGAIFEWDRSAALADFLPFRPNGAPKAVLALRGTLLRSPTMRRDIEDDIRFAVWESLKGSFRFKETLEALQSVSDTHGSRNVCIAGHSLGAGFGLQVGKELAKEGINVEAHIFNPPSVSLAMNIGYVGEKTEYVWNGLKSMFASGSEAQVSNDGHKTYSIRVKQLMRWLSGMMDARFALGNRVPHLYINSNDYISCLYFTVGTKEITDKENMVPTDGENLAKLFVVSKENQGFLEAHSLKQWLSSGTELEQDIHNSKLISQQLRSLNVATPSLVMLLLYPHFVSFAMSHINIKEKTDYIWNILKSVPLSSRQAQDSNDGDSTSGVGLKGWIPQLSGLKDAGFWVVKCVSYLNVYNKDGGTGEKMVEENKDPTNRQLRAKLLVVSKEQQKLLVAHGLKQWWPSDSELVQFIHDRKHIRGKLRYLHTSTHWQVTHLLNPPFVTLGTGPRNIGERQEFVWKWNSLKSMLPSSSETEGRISNDRDKSSEVEMKSWMTQLSGLKDAGFAVGKWVPHMYSNSSDYISRQLRSLYSSTPSRVSHLFNLPSILPDMSHKSTGQKVGFVCETQVSDDKISGTDLKSWIPQLSGLKDTGFRVSNWISQLYARKSMNDTAEKMDDMQVAQGKPV
ncbi:unnamed protein product [Sphenostylis stenocarpa]|uniref:Uncharacterized protein n=1 Tax=Sphenostylis stenocarpa TaxID=92480 RepID=A0AA86VUF0_9FABA|nr:unnamed protein product [Sphenostylis stenocarpa]